MKTLMLKSMAMFALFLTFSLNSQAESWKGITPLKSTRADVERLLGKPLPGEMNSLAVYRLEVGEVHIRYAASRLCSEPDRCECRVPDDTVIEVSVESQVKAKFSSLNIDKRAFERFPLVENTTITIYRNASAGLVYAVSEKEDNILYVQYAPAEKDCQRVLKKTPSANKPGSSLRFCDSPSQRADCWLLTEPQIGVRPAICDSGGLHDELRCGRQSHQRYLRWPGPAHL